MSQTAAEVLTLDQITTTSCADLGDLPRDGERNWLVGPITCADGTKLSVQASRGHYCTPRGNEAPFEEVEVGFPTADPGAAWLQYKDNQSNTDFNDVYAYVPVELVRAFIESHGGEVAATR